MSVRVHREVAFYIAGMTSEERAALAVLLYGERVPDQHGDDTQQIATYRDALDRIAERA